MYVYSKQTGCAYRPGIHGDIPADAVPLPTDLYLTVIANPAPGKIRSHDAAGLPILIDPPPPAAATREHIESARLRAYADPLTGSDRYFAEAVRLQATGSPQEEIDAANAAGAQRYAEIQAEYPWP